jgi:pyruvate,water dikinase
LLNKSGCIDQTRDVFYLHLSELENECKMQEIVIQRKALHDYYEQVPGYTRLVFAEKVFDKTGNLTKNISESSNNHLSGIATSTGIAEGEVLVVNEPNISMDTKGKILVTQSTDPGWVFLIQNAAGIIAEKGSLLSHTAIISRELHKPAIVNVKDCTQILKTGDYVKMNAETGIIHIIKKEE